MSTRSLNQLPPEVLCTIFHYLDITDIVRIRQLSRYLNEVGHNKQVWYDAYRKADFICPPGPLPLQSAHYLEHALVTSYRLDQSLPLIGSTDRKERPTLQAMEIRYTGAYIGASLVFGRFLLIAFKREVRCYDLNRYPFDKNSSASVIHKSTDGDMMSFNCVSSIDVDGRPFACVVLSENMQTTRRISVYSLHVGERSEVTLDLLHRFERIMLDIDEVNLGPRVITTQGHTGPDLGPDRHVVLLDVHTRTQFQLHSLNQVTLELIKLPELTELEIDLLRPTIVSTSTHVLLVKSFYTPFTGWNASFRAFALPSSDTHHHPTSTPTLLHPSHFGLIGVNINGIVLLRDAVLDSSTQDTLITFRASELHPCGILRLSATRTPHGHDPKVGTVTLELLGPVSYSKTPFLHPSVSGTGRAFYMANADAHILSLFEFDLRALPDGEDSEAEAEHPAMIIERKSLLRFKGPRRLLDYDQYTGRVCLGRDATNFRAIEVWDLAV